MHIEMSRIILHPESSLPAIGYIYRKLNVN